jgi:hypothetical protein
VRILLLFHDFHFSVDTIRFLNQFATGFGNYTEERFKDIWNSEQYWRVMDYLASPYFDAKTMMGTLPITHYINVALDRHVRGLEKIVPWPGDSPPHSNFL